MEGNARISSRQQGSMIQSASALVTAGSAPKTPLPGHEWVIVTPALAKSWLHHNNRNRPLRKHVVNMYARDMTAGLWLQTGDPIRFAVDGTLVDGQHRLHAIAQSGVSAVLPVLRGVSVEAQRVMDCGAKRKDADQLRISGIAHASARCAWAFAIYKLIRNTCERASLSARIEIEEKHADGIEWAAREYCRYNRVMIAPVIGAMVFAYPTDPVKLQSFYLALKDGTGLEKGDPAHTLRELLIRDDAKGATRYALDHGRLVSLKTLRAAMVHVQGKKIRRLETSDEGLRYFGKHHKLEL